MSGEEKNPEKLWDEFINSLSNEGFDIDLRKYLNSIKWLAGLDVSNIDNEKYREAIECEIEVIVDFIEKYKNNYYEISCIKGFKKNSDKLIEGRDYYYYIADQQVKASVYYVRYLNFLEGSQLDDWRRKSIIRYLNQLSDILLNNNSSVQQESTEDIKAKCEELITILNKLSFTNINSEENKAVAIEIEDIKQQLVQYLDEIKLSQDIEYKKYMMFNNMMREIRFFGGAFQYLWHWKKEKKTLYRCGELGCENVEERLANKKQFVKTLFQKSIAHMNEPSNICHSFSENFMLDIYKYLVLPTQISQIKVNINIDLEKEIMVSSQLLENNNSVVFKVIKEADINSIFVDNVPKSFHEFIIGEDLKEYDLPYTLEMYPQNFNGKRNDKGTTIGMRDKLLPVYFNSWGLDCSLSKTRVADDKEVITYGKCYSTEVVVDENFDKQYKDFESGTLFSMTLNKEDIINLLLKIFETKKSQQKLDKDFIPRRAYNYLRCDIDYHRFEVSYRNNIDYTIKVRCIKEVEKQYIRGLEFDVVIKGTYFETIFKNKEIPVLNVKNECEKVAKRLIINILRDRYNQILETENKKIDFMLSTMGEDEYSFDLVKQYNEYWSGDAEITMLKYLIFKE